MRAGWTDRRQSPAGACHTVVMHSFNTTGPVAPADRRRVPSRDA